MGSTLGNGRRALADEVPAGYKRTEVGVIPSEWQAMRIGDLFESTAGGDFDPTRSSDVQSDNHPYPIYANGLSQEGLYGFCNYAENRPGSITVTARGTLGKASYRDTPFVAIGRLLVLEPKTGMDARYFSNYINHGVHFAVESTGVPQLTAPQVARYLLPVPPESEQRAIAEALSDVDGLLSALEALIAKKRAVKQAAMQQLLTGKSRLPGFSGAWETTRLGDIASFFKGSGLSKADLSLDGRRRCVHYGELFTVYGERITEVLHGTDREGIFFHSIRNDVLMPTSDVTPNGLATASCILASDTILGGDVLVIRVPESVLNGEFLAYAIKIHRDQVMQLVSGTTVFHLYGRDMANFSFAVPSVDEQTAIVSILSDMDAEIAALERRRDKTRIVKQGMMQQLLTGRVRLLKFDVD